MAAVAATTRAMPPRRRRRSPGWVPTWHGAWAMVSAPLLTGILSTGPQWPHVPLAAFWVLGYFAFYATGLWLKSRRRPRYRAPVVMYGATAALAGLVTLVVEPRLLRWAPLFVIPLGVGLYSAATRHERSLLSGVSTTVGSCLMVLVAHDAGGGTAWSRAWLLAAVLALYFVGTVLYVKTLIRERGNRRYWWLSVGHHVVAAAALTSVSPGLGVVFAVLAVRAAVVPRLGPTPKQAGIAEIGATVAVVAVALMVL